MLKPNFSEKLSELISKKYQNLFSIGNTWWCKTAIVTGVGVMKNLGFCPTLNIIHSPPPKSLYVTIFQNLKSFVSFVWWSFRVLVVSCDWLLSQGQWSYSSLNFSTLLAFQFLITACMNFTFTMQLLILWHDDRTNKKPLKLPFQQEIVSK